MLCAKLELQDKGWFLTEENKIYGPFESLEDLDIFKASKELDISPKEVLQIKLRAQKPAEKKPTEPKPLDLKNVYGKVMENSAKVLESDETAKRLVFLTGFSAYTPEPLNLFMKGKSGSGKTVISTVMTSYFPQKDVWYLGGLSPKALVHEKGEQKEDKRYINLKGKILLFLDSPDLETLTILKPILSHDKEEIEYKYVHAKTHETVHVIIKGWPSAIFCTTDVKEVKEFSRRGITVSPELTESKFKAVIQRQAKKEKYPWLHIGRDIKKDYLCQAIEYLSQKPWQRTAIPYVEHLARIFPYKHELFMSEFPKLTGLIKVLARINEAERFMIEIERGKYVIAGPQDYEEAMWLYSQVSEATFWGVPSFIIDFYNRVLLPQRSIEGISFDQVRAKHLEVYNRELGKSTMYDYCHLLENVGWISLEPDPNDRRRKIIRIERGEKRTVLPSVPFSELFTKKDLENWLNSIENDVKLFRMDTTPIIICKGDLLSEYFEYAQHPFFSKPVGETEPEKNVKSETVQNWGEVFKE